MRIERVTGHAFGPFTGESLDLAPGLTVVSGPNEAGKSSWHAAIRAGSLRRSARAGSRDEGREPPSRNAIVPGTVTAGGRSRFACCSTTVGRSRSARTWPARSPVGRPMSSSAATSPTRSWTERPTPRAGSGSTARPSPPRSASARPRSPRSPAGRRRPRSRSTCSAPRQRAGPMRPPPRRGCDWTSSAASTSGVDRQGARGPLRSAKERVELARGALDDARARHEAFLDATLSAEAAERAASSQSRQAATIEAALAGRSSAELTRRTDRAAELAARYPTEPAGAADRDMRADAVAGALDAWLGRPRAEPLTGTSAAELEAQLASLARGTGRRHRGRSVGAGGATSIGPRR